IRTTGVFPMVSRMDACIAVMVKTRPFVVVPRNDPFADREHFVYEIVGLLPAGAGADETRTDDQLPLDRRGARDVGTAAHQLAVDLAVQAVEVFASHIVVSKAANQQRRLQHEFEPRVRSRTPGNVAGHGVVSGDAVSEAVAPDLANDRPYDGAATRCRQFHAEVVVRYAEAVHRARRWLPAHGAFEITGCALGKCALKNGTIAD